MPFTQVLKRFLIKFPNCIPRFFVTVKSKKQQNKQMLFCRTDAFDDVSSLSLFRFSIGNEHLCQSCKTLLRFKSNHFQATVHLFNFFIMIETVCSALNNTQKMFLFFWSWLADKLHFILSYEVGF